MVRCTCLAPASALRGLHILASHLRDADTMRALTAALTAAAALLSFAVTCARQTPPAPHDGGAITNQHAAIAAAAATAAATDPYMMERGALIDTERRLAVGAGLPLTAQERKLDAIIGAAKQKEYVRDIGVYANAAVAPSPPPKKIHTRTQQHT